MEQSRYGNYQQRKFRSRPRSKKLQGSFEDRNNWIRCWNCGFINRIDRIGTGHDRSGNFYTEVTASEYPPLTGSMTGSYAVIELINEAGVLVEYAANEETSETYSIRTTETAFGCAFCGEANLP
jgi:hypothetical protein